MGGYSSSHWYWHICTICKCQFQSDHPNDDNCGDHHG